MNPATLRVFLVRMRPSQVYEFETETVIQDLDTPEDYERYRPKGNS
jgi:hypothetical protein